MIYLREGEGQYVGPFKSRKDAERFIELMQLCGENWAGTEVVVVDGGWIRRYRRQIASSDWESATRLFSQVIEERVRPEDAREGP